MQPDTPAHEKSRIAVYYKATPKNKRLKTQPSSFIQGDLVCCEMLFRWQHAPRRGVNCSTGRSVDQPCSARAAGALKWIPRYARISSSKLSSPFRAKWRQPSVLFFSVPLRHARPLLCIFNVLCFCVHPGRSLTAEVQASPSSSSSQTPAARGKGFFSPKRQACARGATKCS